MSLTPYAERTYPERVLTNLGRYYPQVKDTIDILSDAYGTFRQRYADAGVVSNPMSKPLPPLSSRQVSRRPTKRKLSRRQSTTRKKKNTMARRPAYRRRAARRSTRRRQVSYRRRKGPRDRRRRRSYRLPKARSFGTQGIPQRALVKHTFYTKRTLQQGTGNPWFLDVGENYRCKYALIKLNDVHTPMSDSYDNTSSGEADTRSTMSCRWTDCFSQFYRKYRVYQCTMTIKVANRPNSGETGASNLRMFVRHVRSADVTSFTPPGTFLNYREFGWRSLDLPKGQTRKLTITFNVSSVERKNKILWKADENYSGVGQADGQTFGSPNTSPYAVVYITSTDDTHIPAETDHVLVETFLTFKTLWFDRPEDLGHQDEDDTIDHSQS